MLKNKNFKERQFKRIYSQRTGIIILVIFMIVSFLFISSPVHESKSTYHSSQLNKICTKDGVVERTEYKDSRGTLTIAADLGYAVMVVLQNEKGRLERYYDDQGKPISRSDGYYAVLREYNDQGNNIRNTYLDGADNPMMTLSGYAIQERVYNKDNRVASIKYYDTDGKPTCTVSYGYGRVYEYDEEGNNTCLFYCDDSGNPMITRLGYASVLRNFYDTEGYEKGKVESEFYFDQKGMPIALSLGQYGVHKEYNELGQEVKLTYLDATGNPMITNKGYTSVERTYQANNYIATERYYDLGGKPFSLSEGQYGIRQINGQTDYLDQNGKEKFNLKKLLYNHSWIVIPICIVAIFLSTVISRKWNVVLGCISILVIIYLTLMFRDNGGTQKAELFGYYKRVFISGEARADIIKNIWLFIPLGANLYQLNQKKHIILIAVILSTFIEITQLVTGKGLCELDDIISNSIGGCIGFFAGKLTKDIIIRIKSWRHIHTA